MINKIVVLIELVFENSRVYLKNRLYQIKDFFFTNKLNIGEPSDTYFIRTCTGMMLRWKILINPQIVFNIEKVINNICKPITIVYINKCTGTYLNKMCTYERIYKKQEFHL
jgi:hypothetical protein